MPRNIRPIRVEGNVAFITLTKGYVAIIDVDDVERVQSFSWRALVVYSNVYGQCDFPRNSGPRPFALLHRLIMNAPKGFDVDHINCNSLDNRKSNMRICTHSENLCNQRARKDAVSPFKGVSLAKCKIKWRARIFVSGVETSLGQFDTEQEAHAAYCTASAQIHKDFGRTK